MGPPQGVSVAPRHGHHNSKRGGNKSALRTQRLLDTSGEISLPAYRWSTTLAQPQTAPTTWTTLPNDLIPYITIHLTISLYSIDITLTNECEIDSLAVMIPGEQSKKQASKRENLPPTYKPYMHHLSINILR